MIQEISVHLEVLVKISHLTLIWKEYGYCKFSTFMTIWPSDSYILYAEKTLQSCVLFPALKRAAWDGTYFIVAVSLWLTTTLSTLLYFLIKMQRLQVMTIQKTMLMHHIGIISKLLAIFHWKAQPVRHRI